MWQIDNQNIPLPSPQNLCKWNNITCHYILISVSRLAGSEVDFFNGTYLYLVIGLRHRKTALGSVFNTRAEPLWGSLNILCFSQAVVWKRVLTLSISE